MKNLFLYMKNQTTKIIAEEIQKFLNEGYVFEHENFKFRQKIDAAFYNYSTFSTDYDMNIGENNIFVSWHVGFWLNDSGIENFIVTVDGIDGIYKVYLHDKQSDEVVQETNKDINEIKWNFEISNAALLMGKTLYIESADFDFEQKKCKINFYNNK